MPRQFGWARFPSGAIGFGGLGAGVGLGGLGVGVGFGGFSDETVVHGPA